MPKYDHLPLQRLEGELTRRKHPFPGGGAQGRDQKTHGRGLQAQIETVVKLNAARPVIADINPALILKVHTSGIVSEEDWARLGLTVLASDIEQTLVLFADDNELQEFHKRVTAYQGDIPEGQKHPQYAALVEAIETVGEISPTDRIGPVLRAEGIQELKDFEIANIQTLDVELWQPSDDDVQLFVFRVARRLEELGGTLVNEYRGSSAVLVRVQGDGDVIRGLLELPEIAVIDRPPLPDLPSIDAHGLTIDEIGPISAPPFGAQTIGIIDSGIAAEHPLLKQAVSGVFGEPAKLGDDDEKGHGTPVSGIVVYGDIRQRVASGDMSAKFRIASAKVVNQNGGFDDTQLVPQQMESAIRRLHQEYGCRVINISLGDIRRPVAHKPSAWAAVLDDLARELDLVIVISAGNVDKGALQAKHGDGIVDAYPMYLLDEDNRILEPASSVNALTVGSIAHSNGLNVEDEDHVGVRPLTLAGHPSPFTRTGPGVGKMIKPDLVDFGGTAFFDGPTQQMVDGAYRPAAGIMSLHHKYLDRLFTSLSGTSFAGPLVAYKAALLLEAFPDASANFVRALLALSAEMPVAALECLQNCDKESITHVLGYGVADIDRALSSDDNRVILYCEDELGIDKFGVYEIPIPIDFQTEKGHRQIRVSLAFDPPVRHTRLDYAGTSMSFYLLRGTTQEDVFNTFRKWEKQKEGTPFKLEKKLNCSLSPGPQMRNRGTLQCGTFTASRNIEHYGDRYFIAVRCEGGWAAGKLDTQRFALAVELRHEAEIQLYARIQERIRLRT